MRCTEETLTPAASAIAVPVQCVASATGGSIVSITTRSGKGPFNVAGSVEGGTFRTNNETLALSGSADQFQYAANIESERRLAARAADGDR